jgi:hypothetical protein
VQKRPTSDVRSGVGEDRGTNVDQSHKERAMANPPKKKTAAKATKRPLEVPRPWSVGPVGGAFEAGDAAYGLSQRRSGFGVTEGDDRLYALGYPHLVIPADVEVDCAALAKGQALHTRYYPWHGGVWARELVVRLAPALHKLTTEAARAEALGAEAKAPDADQLIGLAARSSAPYGEVRVYMAEALFGTKRVLSGMMETWERLGASDWDDYENSQGLLAVPFLLLRVSRDDRADFLARLGKLHLRRAKDPGRALAGLHLLAIAKGDHAAIGELFDKRPLYGSRYLEPGDPRLEGVLVAKLGALKPADRTQFDARMAFLGGDKVTAALAGAHGGFHSTWGRALAEQLARIAHPSARKALTARASKGDARAKEWAK